MHEMVGEDGDFFLGETFECTAADWGRVLFSVQDDDGFTRFLSCLEVFVRTRR